MSRSDTIFRQEAIELHARGRDAPGGVVRLGARWIRWSYRLTLMLVAAGLAAIWLVHTTERAVGPAVVGRGGSVAVLLPAAVAQQLPDSAGLTVALPSSRRSVPVTVLHVTLANPTNVRATGLPSPIQPSILLTGRLRTDSLPADVPRDTDTRTTATVVLRSERVVNALARQFRVMLGHTGGIR